MSTYSWHDHDLHISAQEWAAFGARPWQEAVFGDDWDHAYLPYEDEPVRFSGEGQTRTAVGIYVEDRRIAQALLGLEIDRSYHHHPTTEDL